MDRNTEFERSMVSASGLERDRALTLFDRYRSEINAVRDTLLDSLARIRDRNDRIFGSLPTSNSKGEEASPQYPDAEDVSLQLGHLHRLAQEIFEQVERQSNL